MWSLSRLPILQAPTGSIAGPELCAAVSGSGGLGAMGLTWTDPEIARAFVRQVRETTGASFQVNFVLHFEPKSLIPVLEEGAPAITFSWGMPDHWMKLVRSFGAAIGIQVVNIEGARRAIHLGADFLICQGIEAGGHVQSSIPLDDLLPRVVALAGDVPVVAAGGLADSADVSRVLGLGAAAAMLGTRFVATQESRAHPEYKRRLVEATETALTICFDGGWPHAPHRVLRNSTLEAWEAAGSPPSGRPFEGQVFGDHEGDPILAYEDTAPRLGMSGQVERMCLYAGTGVRRIGDIPSATDLLERLVPDSMSL